MSFENPTPLEYIGMIRYARKQVKQYHKDILVWSEDIEDEKPEVQERLNEGITGFEKEMEKWEKIQEILELQLEDKMITQFYVVEESGGTS